MHNRLPVVCTKANTLHYMVNRYCKLHIIYAVLRSTSCNRFLCGCKEFSKWEQPQPGLSPNGCNRNWWSGCNSVRSSPVPVFFRSYEPDFKALSAHADMHRQHQSRSAPSMARYQPLINLTGPSTSSHPFPSHPFPAPHHSNSVHFYNPPQYPYNTNPF
jgi:hypothetical protein